MVFRQIGLNLLRLKTCTEVSSRNIKLMKDKLIQWSKIQGYDRHMRSCGFQQKVSEYNWKGNSQEYGTCGSFYFMHKISQNATESAILKDMTDMVVFTLCTKFPRMQLKGLFSRI